MMSRPNFSAALLSISRFAFHSVAMFCLVVIANAQTFSVLHTFTGAPDDGVNPDSALTRDSDGNLYGSTVAGGSSLYGTVFKLDSAGNETILHSFDDAYQNAGIEPSARLIRDPQDNLYGAAEYGGTSGCNCGTVFRLTPSGSITVLHSFSKTDGAEPGPTLVSINGVLYGTAFHGGSTGCEFNLGCGVIFRLTKDGSFRILHQFTGGADGAHPLQLVRDSVGNIYGNALSGGNPACQTTDLSGCGVIFRLDSSFNFTVLHSLTGGAGGMTPEGRLVRDVEGNIRGITFQGGDPLCVSSSYPAGGCGTIFRLAPDGNFKVLHTFWHGITNGEYPTSGLLDVGGTLYGVTYRGGLRVSAQDGCGIVYSISKQGHYGVVYRFTGGDDGCQPIHELISDPAGNLYGTAEAAGANGDGVIFKITLGANRGSFTATRQ